jgi:hypothetical protein
VCPRQLGGIILAVRRFFFLFSVPNHNPNGSISYQNPCEALVDYYYYFREPNSKPIKGFGGMTFNSKTRGESGAESTEDHPQKVNRTSPKFMIWNSKSLD